MEINREDLLAAVEAAEDQAGLKRLENDLLGKNGTVTELVKSIAALPAEERRDAGKAANAVKVELRKAIEQRRTILAERSMVADLDASDFDPTQPGAPLPRGTLHPITIVENQIVDLFTSMGFSWRDGPEIETEFFNFEALNIPADHPARDVQDTFWLEDGTLLRTHTSPVQIRTMREEEPPIRIIVPGRTFRQETLDASHEHTFHQVEGLAVDRGVSVAHLIYTMKSMLRGLFQKDVEVRLRPGYFPFVEPGFELDMSCVLCDGAGCSACKKLGWMEILGCGMVHPEVLSVCGIDPEEYSGFAFGLGLSRVTMLKFGINDVRLMMSGDLRFLEQFQEIGP